MNNTSKKIKDGWHFIDNYNAIAYVSHGYIMEIVILPEYEETTDPERMPQCVFPSGKLSIYRYDARNHDKLVPGSTRYTTVTRGLRAGRYCLL